MSRHESKLVLAIFKTISWQETPKQCVEEHAGAGPEMRDAADDDDDDDDEEEEEEK